jgi:hypothetical protein
MVLGGTPFLLDRYGYTQSHSFLVTRQCQLSHYAPGAGSKNHVDLCKSSIVDMYGLLGWWRASDNRHRAVTAKLYLNEPDWKSSGELQCFSDENSRSEEGYRDIVPSGVTLILFDSSLVEHMLLLLQVIDSPLFAGSMEF